MARCHGRLPRHASGRRRSIRSLRGAVERTRHAQRCASRRQSLAASGPGVGGADHESGRVGSWHMLRSPLPSPNSSRIEKMSGGIGSNRLTSKRTLSCRFILCRRRNRPSARRRGVRSEASSRFESRAAEFLLTEGRLGPGRPLDAPTMGDVSSRISAPISGSQTEPGPGRSRRGEVECGLRSIACGARRSASRRRSGPTNQ